MIYGAAELARVRAMSAAEIARHYAGEGGDLVAAIEIYGEERFKAGQRSVRVSIENEDTIQLGKRLPSGGYEMEIRDKDGKLKGGGA